MANVMFKRGAQADLNTLIQGGKFVDGAFYLTTDTDRLYFAQSATELVELNKSITIVDKLADLPVNTTDTSKAINGADVAVGQFYYIKNVAEADAQNRQAGNILAVCDSITGTTIHWTQVNPDTNTDTVVKDFKIEKSGTASATDGLTYNYTVSMVDVDGKTLTPITGSFKIDAADIVTLGQVAVDIDATAGSTNEAVLAIGGAGHDQAADAGKVTLKAGDNTQIAVDNNVVTISSDNNTYALSSAAGETKVTLKEDNETIKGEVTIAADDTYLTADGATAGKIQINHKTSGVTAGTYGIAGAEIGHRGEEEAATKAQFSVPKITVDAAGHVTSATTEVFSLPEDKDTLYSMDAVTAGTGDDAGKLTVSIVDSHDQKSDKTSGQILYTTMTVDGASQTVYNTQDAGSFYSASKIDQMMAGLDALTYKGTVGGDKATTADLPTSNVHIGDTYKVAADGQYDGYDAVIGDLFIATGTENDAGVIVSDLAWTYVGTSSEADTQYTVTVANNKVTMKDNTDTADETAQGFEIAGGTALTASTTGTVAGKDAKITINHDDSGVTAGSYGPAANATPSYGETFTVPSFTVDAQGHITVASDKTITIPASDDTTYQLKGDADKKSLSLTDSNGAVTGDVTFAAGVATEVTLAVTTTNDVDKSTVTVKHADVTRTDSDVVEADQSDYESTFTVVTGVASNAQGHVTDVQKTTFTMPSEHTYKLNADSENQAVQLMKDSTVDSTLTFTSDYSELDGGIKIDVTGDQTKNATAAINLVWGSFVE